MGNALSSEALTMLLGAYFLGAIPFGLIFARWLTGKDPRQHGSGNIGATNAMRTGGKKVGILTLLADIAKGVLPVGFAVGLSLTSFEIAAIALAAFLGHIFPIYLKFKGGKGVATMYGVLIPWMPWVAVCSFVVWLVTFKLSKFVSLASILSGIVLPIFAWLLGASQEGIAACVVLGTLMTVRHHSNIKRLLAGTED
ncbi:MAG: acyl-phosphate glycerol 3-phosphate acyltransferase [Zetaproteobacteria bacterium CG2_30_46_52]|nr:MAG: acyl-phosphate glycerol 3-phosphate acyltransferase [Zetaproteobacteria bacterium CG2_30_46_52]